MRAFSFNLSAGRRLPFHIDGSIYGWWVVLVPVLCTDAAEVAPVQLARQAMVAAHAADGGGGGAGTVVGAERRRHWTKEEVRRVPS
jgi:hypothetical protein